MLNSLHSNLVIFKSRTFFAYSTSLSTLHSNLVIFKFAPSYSVFCLKFFFTFQSGDIQNYRQFVPWKGGVRHFTFQSGDIQISNDKSLRVE